MAHSNTDRRSPLAHVLFVPLARPKMVSVAQESLIPALRERLSDVGVKGVRTGEVLYFESTI